MSIGRLLCWLGLHDWERHSSATLNRFGELISQEAYNKCTRCELTKEPK